MTSLLLLIVYYRTGNLGFPVIILKFLNVKNFWVNFDGNCKIYSKHLLVNKINGIINAD